MKKHHRLRLYRGPARRLVLRPDQHAERVAAINRQLDYLDGQLTACAAVLARYRRLMARRRRLLAQLVKSEADHEEACHPVAWWPADDGPGVVVLCRGGFEQHLPLTSAADMVAQSVPRLPF